MAPEEASRPSFDSTVSNCPEPEERGRISRLFSLEIEPSTRWARIWFNLFTFASLVLTVLILWGCASPHSTAGNIMSIKIPSYYSENGTVDLPDEYILGLAGTCRRVHQVTTCARNLTSTLDPTAFILADIPNSSLLRFMTFYFSPSISHLSAILRNLLLTSLFVTAAGTSVAQLTRRVWANATLICLVLTDTFVLIACIAVHVEILKQQIMGPDDWRAVAGSVGWLLVAALAARMLSNPVLAVGWIVLAGLFLVFPFGLVVGGLVLGVKKLVERCGWSWGKVDLIERRCGSPRGGQHSDHERDVEALLPNKD